MIETPASITCANHPAVQTSLRCNRCDKPICAKCAVRTPIGYRCKECVRGQQKVFITAEWVDYILGFVTAGMLSFFASLLAGLVSGVPFFGWLIIIVAAPTAGAIMAEGIQFVTRKHRSRPLFITIAVGMVMGALPAIIFNLVVFSLFGLIFQILYLVIATPIVYTRLSGIRMTK